MNIKLEQIIELWLPHRPSRPRPRRLSANPSPANFFVLADQQEPNEEGRSRGKGSPFPAKRTTWEAPVRWQRCNVGNPSEERSLWEPPVIILGDKAPSLLQARPRWSRPSLHRPLQQHRRRRPSPCIHRPCCTPPSPLSSPPRDAVKVLM